MFSSAIAPAITSTRTAAGASHRRCRPCAAPAWSGTEVEGEHAEQAEDRRPEGDHARDHALPGFRAPCEVVRRCSRWLRAPPSLAPCRLRRTMERRLVAIALRPRPRLAGQSSSPSARTRQSTCASPTAGAGMALTIAGSASGARRVAAAWKHRRLGDDAGLPGRGRAGRCRRCRCPSSARRASATGSPSVPRISSVQVSAMNSGRVPYSDGCS